MSKATDPVRMTRLFVIGNGFDLHHGIPSRYSDFGRYLEEVDIHTFRMLEDYLHVDEDFWFFFEERLADFDTDSVINYAGRFLASYGADDWSDSGHHDFQYEIDQIIEGIATKTRAHFADWVRRLPIPAVGSIPLLRCVDPSARFLTFNYTPTLQQLYGVPEAHVLHIHGNALDAGSEIVLGHGWTRETAEKLASQIDEDTDTRVAEGYDLIDHYFAQTFKPTDQIIEANSQFFESLRYVNEVWILGHSLADVDSPYFSQIVSHVDPATKWAISYHLEPSREMKGFAGYTVPHNLVRFARLADL